MTTTKVQLLNWDSVMLKEIQKRFKHWGYNKDQINESMFRVGNVRCEEHEISKCQKCSHKAYEAADKLRPN
jgi:hypothetical protein